MTDAETRELLFSINACYPNWNPSDPEHTVKTWHEQLVDVELKDAKAALKKYIESEKGSYIPNISVFVPKRKEIYGFKGRTYSHEFFEKLEEENKGW